MEVDMDSVINSIFCYGFHDTNINYIIINNDEITIYFDGGLYCLDNNKNEDKLIPKLKMIIKTELFYERTDAGNNMNVWDSRHGDLDLDYFLKKVKNKSFGIDNLYYSSFNNSILIDGNNSILIDGFFDDESNMENGIIHKMLLLIENCKSVKYSKQ